MLASMAKAPTISILESAHPRYKFVVVMSRGGRRIKQRFVRSKKIAETVAAEMESEASEVGTLAAASITYADKVVIHQAKEALAEHNKTLRDALDFYLAHLKRKHRRATVGQLVDEVVDRKTKENRSARYIGDLRNRLTKFKKDYGEWQVADIDTATLDNWLTGLKVSAVTVLNFRRVLSVAFAQAIISGYCQSNPAKLAFKPKTTDNEIGILTPTEANALLTSADPEILPVIAIGLFTGLRTAELQRLDWRDVDWHGKHVEVKASNAKSARRRLVRIQPNLEAWLAPHANLAGPVWPAQQERGRNLLDAAKRKAGFGNPKSLTKEEKEAKIELRPWPHNAMRHSFASYHVAHFKNAAELALELGHTNAQLIFQHYREIVKPKAAEAYWNIQPKIEERKDADAAEAGAVAKKTA